ncbi:MAG: hypothetical protein KDB01_08650 [Planctomycetaceae bacterium]|nr:hypothetical protein [Planctomycetaceae bacterium]
MSLELNQVEPNCNFRYQHIDSVRQHTPHIVHVTHPTLMPVFLRMLQKCITVEICCILATLALLNRTFRQPAAQ